MDPAHDLNLGWNKRLPLVLQTEAAECGLACLAMLSAYHGYPIGLVGLRARFGFSLRGARLDDIMRIADGIGLAGRPLRVDLDEMHLLKTPCLLHWDLNHFVVLKSASRSGLVVHDPALGLRKVSMAEASRSFTGVALEVAPTSGFESAEPLPRVRLSALLGRMRGVNRSLLHLLALALAIELLAIAGPLFMQWVIDHALVTADADLLMTLMLGFLLFLLVRTATTAMRGWMLMTLTASLNVQARTNLFSHLVNLPTAFFEARHLGDIMSRFDSQDTMLQAITTELIEGLLDGLMAVVTLIIMFVFAPKLALMVVAGAALYGLLRWGFYTRLRIASNEAIVWSARRNTHFLETLRGITTIKLFNGQDSRRGQWVNLLVEALNRQLDVQKLRLLFKTANALLVGMLAILVIWVGARMVLDNTFTVGMLLAFIAYKDQFLNRVSDLINKAVDLRMLRLHAERLADIALTQPEARTHALMPTERPQRPAAIEVRDLRFRYSDNDPWVLDGVSFKIAPGESVAIVGASGCGKTTLLKLLASLLKPTSGEILIDGEPLVGVGIERYRAMIGVVMQEDKLFAGSIADNIAFLADRPDHERIQACAQLAAIHDDIVAMPMSYGTLIGDMGTVLSGGQKQRVIIARALYRQPNILLLDEATSHLDVNLERAVNVSVGASQITRIIVAHRPETIRSADRVIQLDRGLIVQDKIQEELLPDRWLASEPGRKTTEPTVAANVEPAAHAATADEKPGPGQTGRRLLWSARQLKKALVDSR